MRECSETVSYTHLGKVITTRTLFLSVKNLLKTTYSHQFTLKNMNVKHVIDVYKRQRLINCKQINANNKKKEIIKMKKNLIAIIALTAALAARCV